MKKFTKITLIVVAVMAGVGILLCGIASMMGAGSVVSIARSGGLDFGNWHIGATGIYYSADEDDWVDVGDIDVGDISDEDTDGVKLSDQELPEDWEDNLETAEYAVSSVQNIKFEIDAAEVLVEASEDAQTLGVRLIRGQEKYYDCALEGDTLTISYQSKGHYFRKAPKIVVMLPEEAVFHSLTVEMGASALEFQVPKLTVSELSVDAGVGSLEAERFDVSERMEINVGLGSVEIADGTYGEMNLDCGMGNIAVGGKVLGNVTGSCSMGNLELDFQGKEMDYNYDLSCSMGNLEINGKSYSSINGMREVRNEGAVGTITLDCGMGNVELNIE